jgi:hypothetical protein
VCSVLGRPRLWKIGIKWSANFWEPAGGTGGMALNPSASRAWDRSCMASATYQLGRLTARV